MMIASYVIAIRSSPKHSKEVLLSVPSVLFMMHLLD